MCSNRARITASTCAITVSADSARSTASQLIAHETKRAIVIDITRRYLSRTFMIVPSLLKTHVLAVVRSDVGHQGRYLCDRGLIYHLQFRRRRCVAPRTHRPHYRVSYLS